MACNLIYIHLRPGHSSDCVQGCSSSCPQWRYDQALGAPLLPVWQVRAAERARERIRQRREALLRGDIPA